jgi:hypothetical protein
MNKVIDKQLQFVEWLKSKGIYNEYDSAGTMQQMQKVYDLCQAQARLDDAFYYLMLEACQARDKQVDSAQLDLFD